MIEVVGGVEDKDWSVPTLIRIHEFKNNMSCGK